MDIYSQQGTKVVFTACGGMDGEIEYAKEQLVVGKIYTVRRTEVHSWSSDVYLEEFPGVSFNTCLFDEWVGKLKDSDHYEGVWDKQEFDEGNRIVRESLKISKLDEICKKAIEKWGKDAELIMVFEELSELGVEIAKAMRQGVHNDPKAFSGSCSRIAGEVADVEIMLNQVKQIFGVSDVVDEIKSYKLKRMERRLE